MARLDKVVMQTYGRTPIMLVRGEGCRVYDEGGREYLDFVAGIAVCALGHAHPKLVAAVCEQMGRLTHVSNLYYTAPQVAVAEKLVDSSFADRVFFCNSGAEANEGAIKLARAYAKKTGRPGAFWVICMERSFHGRTLATLSATGQDKIKKGFEPVVEGFMHAPFGDLDAVEVLLDETIAAVLVEPILGEGGVVIPADDYLPGLRDLCDRTGALLMFDEIQTGLGRTGRLWGHEHWSVFPDVMTLAKGLAGGLPMGAVLATEKAASALGPGMHATTFGAGPVVCAAAGVVLEELIDHGLIEHAARMGETLRRGLEELQSSFPRRIQEVRGKGLLCAVELVGPGAGVVQAMVERGFLVNCTQENVLRFLPPLIVTEVEIEALLGVLPEVL
ncbi:MAG: acetylornithine transaminase [Proteobacteria bacterium]|nr:acetylornithine transaminase [Pseudomonadota bacterium]MBU1741407.1 acetylornithine transaminase [Pseudomonadota bacterium]